MTLPVVESLLAEGFSVFHMSRPHSLNEDLRVPAFGSNSIKIKLSLVCYRDGHGDQAKSFDTSFDPGIGHWLRRYSSRSCFTTTDDRYTYH